MQIPAASVHGGIHTHLPDQLLLVMDEVLGGASSSATIHVELHAPIMVATAQNEELSQIFEQIFGHNICQSIAIEGSEEMPDERTVRSEVSNLQDAMPEDMVPHSADGSDAQKIVPLPSTPAASSSKSFNAKATASSSANDSTGALTDNNKDSHKPSTTAAGNRSQPTDLGDAGVAPDVLKTSKMVLVLPGASFPGCFNAVCQLVIRNYNFCRSCA